MRLRHTALVALALTSSCGGSPVTIEPEPAVEPRMATEPSSPAEPPGSSAGVPLIVTNGGASPLAWAASTGISALDVEGLLAPGGIHLPPFGCECACGVVECPCAGWAEGTPLAPGASVERTWEGAMRRLRAEPTGVPCHEPIVASPGRYVFRACSDSGARCGTTEVDLPATGPITISIPEVSAPASCEDGVRARRAARVALGAARLAGALPASLADCDPLAARCGARSEVNPDETPGRCALEVSAAEDRYEVRVAPAARSGAPIEIEVWVDADAVSAGRVDVAPTEWAVSSDGLVLVRGEPRSISHTHGGAPAHIGWARYRITNRSDLPVPLAVTHVEWNDTGNVREVAPATIAPAMLPPHATTEVEVGYPAQSAYAAFHERFSSRVTFDAGGRAITATVEHHVFRRDPIVR